MKLALSLPMILFLLSSCVTLRTIQDFDINPIPDGLELSQIEKGIKVAGSSKRWLFKKSNKENTLRGYLSVRSHKVVVNISYTKENYKIQYFNSLNMKYNKKTNKIHRSYFKWVDHLKRRIDVELLRVSVE